MASAQSCPMLYQSRARRPPPRAAAVPACGYGIIYAGVHLGPSRPGALIAYPRRMPDADTVVEAARGLTTQQVAERVAQGRGNDVAARNSRGVWEIIRANV